MKISGIGTSRNGDRTRAAATVEWEDADRPSLELYFEGGDAIAADPHAFLLAAIVPAWRHGERRVAIEGAICPRLRDGLRTAQKALSEWARVARRPAAIEPSAGFQPYAAARERAGLFLTGGVDSLHILRVNRQFYPIDHAASFRDAVYAKRFAFLDASPRAIALAARQERAIAQICRETGIELLSIDSNFRLLESDLWLVSPQDHGALLAAVAHTIAGRIGSVSLAASFEATSLPGWGTHPLLDPLYGSSGLEVRHEGFGRSRLEKIEAIADWEVAQRHLIVCFEGPLPDGALNCGRCEKCLRTMTALMTLGALENFSTFPASRVTVDALEQMSFGYSPEHFEFLWAPLIDALLARGEARVANAIRAKLREVKRLLAWQRESNWRGRMRRLDRRYLGGALTRVTRRMRRLPRDG